MKFIALTLFSLLTLPSLANRPAGAEYALTAGDARVGTYTSSWKGFRTSSYWIEGPEGLIIVDTQFLISAAEEMLNWAEAVTGKKAKLAVVLHSNPDKFNGTTLYQKRGIKVVTSEQVLSHIPAVHKLRTGWFYEKFKPDYPAEEPKPESFGNTTTELKAAGLTVKAHILREGCSDAHVVLQFEDNVFVGDLVTIGFHSWLELGHLNSWLERIKEIKAMNPRYVRTGRGGSGDGDSLNREEEYLKTVIGVFKKYHPQPGKTLSEATGKKILNEILAKYPGYEYAKFVENGLESSWEQLSAQPTKKH